MSMLINITVDHDEQADMTLLDDPHDESGTDDLDRAFLALADPVRRSIVATLSSGPATVNELAAPFPITKQAVSRHIQVLETAGLITRSRDGQRRPCHLDPAALERLTAWIDEYRLTAERQYRRLDALLGRLQAPSSDPSKEQS